MGFCATCGEGRGGLEETTGGLALAPPATALSLGRVEANLLPVGFSLTSRGLKPNKPPPPLLGAGWGLGLGVSVELERGMVVAFLIPPIGGGGGGGGGAPTFV